MRKERGITLVALVITLLLLLILTAVVVKSIIDMDVIKLTADAAEKYKQEEKFELDEMNKINDILTGTLGDITGAIEFGALQWNNYKASVTVTKRTDKDYKIEYKVIDKNGNTVREYTEIESGGTISGLNLGDVVKVRLTDGKNHTANTASLEVIDIGAPEVTAEKTGVTGTSVTLALGATDKEAGMPSPIVYKVYIKKTTEESYSEIPAYTGSENNPTIDGLDAVNHYDIKVVTNDMAGNIGEAELKDVILNTPPKFVGTQSGVATSNTAMTITATATDDEQEKLHYILRYSSVSEADLDTTNAKTKELDGNKGQEVSFDLTEEDGISNYTTYYWRIDVSDNVATTAVQGTAGTTQTWCNLATSCSGKVSSTTRCMKCDGTGKVNGNHYCSSAMRIW